MHFDLKMTNAMIKYTVLSNISIGLKLYQLLRKFKIHLFW